METLYRVLEIINWVCIGLTTIGLVWQLIFIIFSFLKPKHFKKANKQNRFAIIIPAHNEAEVVGRTVKELLTKQDYPMYSFAQITVLMTQLKSLGKQEL